MEPVIIENVDVVTLCDRYVSHYRCRRKYCLSFFWILFRVYGRKMLYLDSLPIGDDPKIIPPVSSWADPKCVCMQ